MLRGFGLCCQHAYLFVLSSSCSEQSRKRKQPRSKSFAIFSPNWCFPTACLELWVASDFAKLSDGRFRQCTYTQVMDCHGNHHRHCQHFAQMIDLALPKHTGASGQLSQYSAPVWRLYKVLEARWAQQQYLISVPMLFILPCVSEPQWRCLPPFRVTGWCTVHNLNSLCFGIAVDTIITERYWLLVTVCILRSQNPNNWG